ncbi:MAG: hypothetical protein AAF611_07735 [Bacteroidota bacterium]
MNTDVFPYRNVQEYLDATGVLETGTAEEIELARKTFRKLYLKQYQKQRYTITHTNVSISFSKKEKARIEKYARDNEKSLARYIKEIVFAAANIEQRELPSNSPEIKRLLSLSYDIAEALAYENSDPELKKSYDDLLELFEQLEKLVS